MNSRGWIPTAEQAAARDLFVDGESMVIEALAGTGKTSTLRLCAESTRLVCRYLAYNTAIVEDVRGSMPLNVQSSTAHSLAMAAVGGPYRHRLDSHRMKSWELARNLSIYPHRVRYGTRVKTLSDGFLAGLVMRALGRFCQTLDEAPDVHHFPYVDGIDVPDDQFRRTYENNHELRRLLRPALRRAWLDVSNPQGQLPFKHDHYLKLWQLSRPTIVADVIFFDEAQDANPVMASVVDAQDHAQRVRVGDSYQAIYEFTGAVNALARIEEAHRCYLTHSFRFGPAIAERANRLLARLGSPIKLTGTTSMFSTVGDLGDELPDAILCRTNAEAMNQVLALQRDGVTCHLVGGGGEVYRFAEAAGQIQAGERTLHPDLACFDSWGEVQTYVQDDPQGDELRLLVDLVDTYGVGVILAALGRMPPEAESLVCVSTAHKAKGREWGRVKLAGDFAAFDADPGELRLQYVAVTRAREHLDASALDAAPHRQAEDGPPAPVLAD